MPLDTPTLQLQLVSTLTGTPVQGGTPTFPINLAWAAPLVTGIGLGQADKIYAPAQITLAPSAGLDIDLAGVVLDPFGLACTMVKIKAVLIKASALNVNNVNLTRPAANGVPWFLAASDGFGITPGEIFMRATPALAGLGTVTPGTGDLLRVDNSGAGTSVIFDLVVIGTSA